MQFLDYLRFAAAGAVVLVFVAFGVWQLRARRRLARAVPAEAAGRRARFRPTNWAPAFFLLAVALAFAVGGYRIIRANEREATAAAYRQLAAIADLSVAQIENWLAERKADAASLAANVYVAGAVRAVLAGGERSGRADAELRRWLRELAALYHYEDILLVDARGAVRASANPNARPPSRAALEDAARSIRTRSVVIGGFQVGRRGEQPRARIGIAAPVAAGSGPRDIVPAAFVFRIDPEQFLLPTVERWPTPSESGETVFAMVDEGRVLYLSRLRHAAREANPPAGAEAPLPAMVAYGAQGPLEGVDYRGVPVLGVGRAVRDTPWVVIAKIDADEAQGPIRREAAFLAVVTLAFIVAAAFLIGLWWRGQLIRFAAAQREARLREQALVRHFEYLSRFANDIVLLTDDKGCIVEANDRALSAYGYPKERLLGMPMSALREPSASPRFPAQDEASDGILYETLHRRNDGTAFPVEVSVRLLDAQGRAFAQAIIRDVSERRRAEATLQLHAMVFESAGDAIMVTDAAGKIVSVNRAFEAITGYAEAEAAGRDPRLLASGRHDREFYREMWRTIAEKGIWQGEIWNRKKTGEALPAWETIAAVKDEEGRVANYVAIFSDVTERTQAEERLRFQAHILDMIGEAVIAIDPEGRVTYWNRGAEALYELPAAAVLGRSIFAIAGGHLVDPADIDIVRDGGRVHSREIELKNATRGSFVVLLTISPIVDADGAPAGHIGVSRDITERKQAEARLAQLAQYDTLTGLPNRNLFRDRLDQAMARARRGGRSMALMFLDLDRFKDINDTLGHAAGDELLCAVSDRFQGSLRGVDTIARLGGDEFTVIVESVGREEAGRVAAKLVELLSAPVTVAGRQMRVTGSVGVTLYPDDAADAEELVKTADIAMYQAKNAGRNAYRFYSAAERFAPQK
jgi:diguanylate cyclase (GGDEF)-like protein/PAS domain S-box-containing protein